MKPLRTMREALTDPQLLGGAMPGESWRPWRTLLIAAMGERLDEDERALYSALTEREHEPEGRVRQFWGIVGRRAGKTRAAGTFGAYVATCCDFSDCLAPGERAVLPVLASSRQQAGKAFAHVRGVLEHSPMLSKMIDGEPTADTIRLTVPVDIEIRPANFKTIRGITAVAAVADELAFWDVEGSANPDKEILAALRPALLTTSGMLWVISSPFAKSGELYKTYRKHYGAAGTARVLVAKGPSLAFNSTLDPAEIAEEFEDDAEVASAEYGGNFREDLADFVSLEAVEACVSSGVFERPWRSGCTYHAFVDNSGGRGDSASLAIARESPEAAGLDYLVERRPPFSPDDVVRGFAETLRRYGLSSVTGDGYAAEWAVERFRAHGIAYLNSTRSRSEIYLNFLPLVNAGRVDLLDSERLVRQLVNLKRRVTRGGRDSVDHVPGQHDDVANAAAGALGLCVLAARVPAAASGTYHKN